MFGLGLGGLGIKGLGPGLDNFIDTSHSGQKASFWKNQSFEYHGDGDNSSKIDTDHGQGSLRTEGERIQ